MNLQWLLEPHDDPGTMATLRCACSAKSTSWDPAILQKNPMHQLPRPSSLLPPSSPSSPAIPSTGFHFASAHSSPQPQGPPSYHFIHRSLDLAFLSGSPVPAQHGCPRCSQRPQSAFSSLNCLFPSGYIPSFLYSPRIPQLSPYSYFLPLLWMCSILWSGNVPIILSQPPSSGLVPLLETPLSGISCFSIRVSWN